MPARKQSPVKTWYAQKSVQIKSLDEFNAFIEGGFSAYGLKRGAKNTFGMSPTHYFHCKRCTELLGTFRLVRDCNRGGNDLNIKMSQNVQSYYFYYFKKFSPSRDELKTMSFLTLTKKRMRRGREARGAPP